MRKKDRKTRFSRGGRNTQRKKIVKQKQKRQRAELTSGSIKHQSLRDLSHPIEESVRTEHHIWLFPL